MVLPILTIAFGLIMTIGGTASRLLDRLGIRFKFAIIVQVALVVLVILPYITVSRQKLLGLLSVLMTFLAGIVFFAYRPGIQKPVTFLCGLLVSGGVIFLMQLLFGREIPDSLETLLLGVMTAGIAFLFARDHRDAFLLCILPAGLCYAALFFSPAFDIAGLTVTVFSSRFVNSTVYALYLGQILMNLFKRMRGNYAQNYQSAAGFGRRGNRAD